MKIKVMTGKDRADERKREVDQGIFKMEHRIPIVRE